MATFWSVVGKIPQTKGDQFPVVASEAHFNKQVSCANSQKVLIKYMPVISQLLSDNSVLKAYLLFLVETTENLEIEI